MFFLQLFSSSFISLKVTFPKILHGPLFIFHTTTGVLGYASLVISAIYSFVYLLLFYDIKKSRFGLLYERLPSLEILQEMNLKTAKLGFFFFSLTILFGIVWSIRIKEGTPWDFKNLAVYGAWLIYGVEIVGGRFGKWSGKKLAYLSLGGLVLLMFSLVVVNLFLTSYHTFK